MSIEIPLNDPSGAYGRKKRAARRSGKNRRCACGETRPNALIPKSDPTICARCQRETHGYVTTDKHHFAGEANHWLTVSVPVNDHRADLSTAQYDWPKATEKTRTGVHFLLPPVAFAGLSTPLFI